MSDKLDAKIRGLILQTLYKKRRETPRNPMVLRKKMIESMDVEEAVMDFHIYYLEEKRLITLRTSPNSPWINAKITATGIDHVDRGN